MTIKPNQGVGLIERSLAALTRQTCEALQVTPNVRLPIRHKSFGGQMVHRYTIKTKNNEQLSVPKNTATVSINGCNVSWGVNDDGKLEKIIMDITGRPIIQDDTGRILSSCPEIDAIAFNMATFLSNNIFIQTSIDAIDPYVILAISPELIPESTDEEKLLKSTPKLAYASLDGKVKIPGKFDPQKYASNSNISIAIAHFAAAGRSTNHFHKFESFFKVLESIFQKAKNEKVDEFDLRVSEYTSKIDTRFTLDVIRNLRRVRNRCVHPDNPTHLSPEDLIAVREVQGSLNVIEKLARLSLNNPPSVP